MVAILELSSVKSLHACLEILLEIRFQFVHSYPHWFNHKLQSLELYLCK